MKRLAAALLCLALATARAEDPAAIEAEVNKAADLLREQLKASLAKVDAAITAAVKEGGIKPSTEAYFRDCLSHFQTSPAGLSEADRAYFPPRFDSTPELEPINLAWADLRAEFNRQQREQDGLFARLATAAGEALNTAARSGERAADFAPVLKLIKEMEAFADPGKVRRTAYNDADEKEQISAYRSTAQAMSDALEARASHNEAVLNGAFARLGIGTSSSRVIRVPAITSAEAIFRTRMLQPYRDEATAAQGKLEDALMARRPAAELDRLLTAYSAAHRRLAAVLGPYDRDSQQSSETPRYYERIAHALQSLADHDPTNRADLAPPRDDLALAHPASFRAFALELARDLRRLENRGTPGTPDLGEKNDGAAAAKVRTDLSAQIDAVQTPEAVAALADTVAQMNAPRSGPQTSAEQNLRNQLQTVEQALRQIASAWSTGQLAIGSDRNFLQGEPSTALLLRVGRLHQRALRDTLARQHHLPELKQPPAAELPVAEALQSFADAAAEKGDWKKALQLLEILQSPESARPNTRVLEQVQAIRAYLTALNFEQAEQYPQAIMSLQRVLMTVADHVPIAESTAKLKQFRADHPDAFKSLPPALDQRVFLNE